MERHGQLRSRLNNNCRDSTKKREKSGRRRPKRVVPALIRILWTANRTRIDPPTTRFLDFQPALWSRKGQTTRDQPGSFFGKLIALCFKDMWQRFCLVGVEVGLFTRDILLWLSLSALGAIDALETITELLLARHRTPVDEVPLPLRRRQRYVRGSTTGIIIMVGRDKSAKRNANMQYARALFVRFSPLWFRHGAIF